MATRTVTFCDRCGKEATKVSKLTVGNRDIELGQTCREKLDDFLSGSKLMSEAPYIEPP